MDASPDKGGLAMAIIAKKKPDEKYEDGPQGPDDTANDPDDMAEIASASELIGGIKADEPRSVASAIKALIHQCLDERDQGAGE